MTDPDITEAELQAAIDAAKQDGTGGWAYHRDDPSPWAVWWQRELPSGSLVTAEGRGLTRKAALEEAQATQVTFASETVLAIAAEDVV